MKRTAFLAAAMLAVAVPSVPLRAQQQPPCGPRAVLVQALAERYGETLRIRAREQRGGLIEIFVAANGGWTMLVTRPDGTTSCVVGAGTEFDDKPPAEPGTRAM
jgi:hypothetical protein